MSLRGVKRRSNPFNVTREERSDEAIHTYLRKMDCRVALRAPRNDYDYFQTNHLTEQVK